jgi:hypothetical protein
VSDELTILYRPVGQRELELIARIVGEIEVVAEFRPDGTRRDTSV